jgi:hypothetical protein
MTQIVIGAEVKDRAKTISKFINAAKVCRRWQDEYVVCA